MISGLGASSTAVPDVYRTSVRPSRDQESPGSPPTREESEQAVLGSESRSKDGQDAETPKAGAPRGLGGKPLTEEQQQVVRELQMRDREVRAHEGAHKAAGGSLAGGMSFSYQTGPDGRRYAVGGEVSIDTGGGGDPQATIAKMRQVIAASLAPADPSAQDRAVAAAARATMADAQRQYAEQQRVESSGGKEGQDKQEAKQAERAAADKDAPARQARGYGKQPLPSGSLLNLVA